MKGPTLSGRLDSCVEIQRCGEIDPGAAAALSKLFMTLAALELCQSRDVPNLFQYRDDQRKGQVSTSECASPQDSLFVHGELYGPLESVLHPTTFHWQSTEVYASRA